MKTIRTLLFLILLGPFVIPAASAQQAEIEKIRQEVTRSDAELNIYFLASDELRGRDTGTHELDIAARYIATWFHSNGIEKVPGQDHWFQDVPFTINRPAEQATLALGDSLYTLNEDLLSLGKPDSVQAPVLFLEHATAEEIEQNEVAGRMIITQTGYPDQTSLRQHLSASQEKRLALWEAGAAGLVELYTNTQISWSNILSYLGRETLELDSTQAEAAIPHLWINAIPHSAGNLENSDGEIAEISVAGPENEYFTSRNVIGFVEGTDPELKDEIVLLSAHYDHTGTGEEVDGDSINNGARDNAVGTSAIMQAAKYVAKNPPRRSVLIAAWTAEEKGLLGSRWFAENPPVPLGQIVYNLNIDGAGYNDTTKVTVIGLERTEAEDDLSSAAEAFGLEAIPDPAPEQNLFDRSDNVNFARKGIPSPTYSMGFTAFDDEIGHYYHRVTDEADTINYDYVTNYIRSYVLAVMKVANSDEAPFWLPGDEYEEAGLELYDLKKISN